MRLEDSPNGGLMAHHNSESSLVVGVKSKQYLDQSLMELKKSVLSKLNVKLSLGGWCFQISRKVVCSQCSWFEMPDS